MCRQFQIVVSGDLQPTPPNLSFRTLNRSHLPSSASTKQHYHKKAVGSVPTKTASVPQQTPLPKSLNLPNKTCNSNSKAPLQLAANSTTTTKKEVTIDVREDLIVADDNSAKKQNTNETSETLLNGNNTIDTAAKTHNLSVQGLGTNENQSIEINLDPKSPLHQDTNLSVVDSAVKKNITFDKHLVFSPPTKSWFISVINKYFPPHTASNSILQNSLKLQEPLPEKGKMWSSRNRILMDNEGDDVAFLSGSGKVHI